MTGVYGFQKKGSFVVMARRVHHRSHDVPSLAPEFRPRPRAIAHGPPPRAGGAARPSGARGGGSAPAEGLTPGYRRRTCSQSRATLSVRSAVTVSVPVPHAMRSRRPAPAAGVAGAAAGGDAVGARAARDRVAPGAARERVVAVVAVEVVVAGAPVLDVVAGGAGGVGVVRRALAPVG